MALISSVFRKANKAKARVKARLDGKSKSEQKAEQKAEKKTFKGKVKRFASHFVGLIEDLALFALFILCGWVLTVLLIVFAIVIILIVIVESVLKPAQQKGVDLGKLSNVTPLSIQTASTADYTSLDWDSIVQKAEQMQTTGQFSRTNVNIVKAMALAYNYKKQHTDMLLDPEVIMGVAMKEDSFNMAKGVNDILSDSYRDGNDTVLNATLGYMQMYQKGATDDSVSLCGTTYPSASQLSDEFYPSSMIFLFHGLGVQELANQTSSKLNGATALNSYVTTALSMYGIQDNVTSRAVIANMFAYLFDWAPSPAKAGNIADKDAYFNAIASIAGGIYKATDGDIFKFAVNLNVNSYTSDDVIVPAGGTEHAGLGNPSGYTVSLNGQNINDCLVGYIANTYKAQYAGHWDGTVAGFGNTQSHNGGMIMASSVMLPIAGRSLVNAYLKAMGIALPTSGTGGGGGKAPFGLNYYNSDGSINQAAIAAADNNFHVFTDHLGSSTVTVTMADGTQKQYPNFWSSAQGAHSIGQCVWWTYGRLALYMYENNLTYNGLDWSAIDHTGHYGNGNEVAGVLSDSTKVALLAPSGDSFKPDTAVSANVSHKGVNTGAGHTYWIEAVSNGTYYYTQANWNPAGKYNGFATAPVGKGIADNVSVVNLINFGS